MKKLKILPPAVVIIGLLAFWQILTTVFNIPAYLIPKPTDICQAFIADGKKLFFNATVTLTETLIGIFIAVISGIIIAVLLDGSKLLRSAFYPLLVISQTIPVIVLAPIFVIYFGFGIAPKIITVALMCFFPITVNFLDGLINVDKRLVNLVKSYGAGKIKTYIFVKFPAAMPELFSGLKIAVTYSVTGAIIGEWMASSEGLGHYMLMAKTSYYLSGLYAAVILVIVLSLLLVLAVNVMKIIFVKF